METRDTICGTFQTGKPPKDTSLHSLLETKLVGTQETKLVGSKETNYC